MVDRFVTVGDNLTLPASVKAADVNMPAHAKAAVIAAKAEASDPRLPTAENPEAFYVKNKDGGVPFKVENDSVFLGGNEVKPNSDERFTIKSSSDHLMIEIDPVSGKVYAPNLHADTLTVGGVVGAGGAGVSRVVLLVMAGQSNGEGRGKPYSDELDPADSRIGMWNWPTRTITTATVPLSSQQSQIGLSPATVIARQILATEVPGTQVVVLNAAAGGSGLVAEPTQGTWKVGYVGANPRLFEKMMTELALLIPAITTKYGLTPEVRFFWHQGEADSATPTATYATAFDALVAEVRTRLALPSMTVTLGGLLPLYGNPIMDVHEATPSRLFRAGYAPANPNGGGSQALDDLVHLHRSGVEELGAGMYKAYRRALTNISTSIPTPPMDVSATLFAGKLTATWTPPMCRVTDYLVEYSVDAGAWVPITGRAIPSAPKATVTGLTGTVRVRVSTINANGTAVATVPVTAVGA